MSEYATIIERTLADFTSVPAGIRQDAFDDLEARIESGELDDIVGDAADDAGSVHNELESLTREVGEVLVTVTQETKGERVDVISRRVSTAIGDLLRGHSGSEPRAAKHQE